MLKAIVAIVAVPASLVALSASGLAQMSQANAPESQGRRICRSTQETGKLASRRRVCLTRAEWERAGEEQRRVGRLILDTLDSCRARAEGGNCG